MDQDHLTRRIGEQNQRCTASTTTKCHPGVYGDYHICNRAAHIDTRHECRCGTAFTFNRRCTATDPDIEPEDRHDFGEHRCRFQTHTGDEHECACYALFVSQDHNPPAQCAASVADVLGTRDHPDGRHHCAEPGDHDGTAHTCDCGALFTVGTLAMYVTKPDPPTEEPADPLTQPHPADRDPLPPRPQRCGRPSPHPAENSQPPHRRHRCDLALYGPNGEALPDHTDHACWCGDTWSEPTRPATPPARCGWSSLRAEPTVDGAHHPGRRHLCALSLYDPTGNRYPPHNVHECACRTSFVGARPPRPEPDVCDATGEDTTARHPTTDATNPTPPTHQCTRWTGHLGEHQCACGQAFIRRVTKPAITYTPPTTNTMRAAFTGTTTTPSSADTCAATQPTHPALGLDHQHHQCADPPGHLNLRKDAGITINSHRCWCGQIFSGPLNAEPWHRQRTTTNQPGGEGPTRNENQPETPAPVAENFVQSVNLGLLREVGGASLLVKDLESGEEFRVPVALRKGGLDVPAVADMAGGTPVVVPVKLCGAMVEDDDGETPPPCVRPAGHLDLHEGSDGSTWAGAVRCDAVLRDHDTGGDGPACRRLLGHAGSHESAGGAAWTECGAVLDALDAYPCVRPEGHPGMHEDRNSGLWENDRPEACGAEEGVACVRAGGHTGPHFGVWPEDRTGLCPESDPDSGVPCTLLEGHPERRHFHAPSQRSWRPGPEPLTSYDVAAVAGWLRSAVTLLAARRHSPDYTGDRVSEALKYVRTALGMLDPADALAASGTVPGDRS